MSVRSLFKFRVLIGCLTACAGVHSALQAQPASPAAAASQLAGTSLTLRTGFAGPDDAYQSGCAQYSMAYSADVQGRGHVFPHVGLDYHHGSGGGDVLCLAVPESSGALVAGLQLKDATRLSVGIGARGGVRLAYAEAVLRGGVMRGRPGYEVQWWEGTVPPDAELYSRRGRLVRPQVGAQASVVLLRVFVLSGNLHWTRLTREFRPANGGPATRSSNWAPMGTIQFGIRLPP